MLYVRFLSKVQYVYNFLSLNVLNMVLEIFVIVVCNFMIFKCRVTKQEIHGKDGTVSKAEESA